MGLEKEMATVKEMDVFVRENEKLENVEIAFLSSDKDVRLYIVEEHEQFDILEDKLEELSDGSRYGFDLIQIVFSDEYIMCDHCYGKIHTTPTSAFWHQDWWQDDNGTVCRDCVRKDFQEEYLEFLTDNYRKANVILSHDELLENGWKRLEEEYTAGMSYGYINKPESVYEHLKDKYESIVFSITSTTPFDTSFSVYVK